VDRSHKKHPDGYHLLARGDDFGKVTLMKYPSLIKPADGVEGAGHSSHVPCVKWGPTDDFLYSVGGEDNTVF
jgi:WD40 repeat protein